MACPPHFIDHDFVKKAKFLNNSSNWGLFRTLRYIHKVFQVNPILRSVQAVQQKVKISILRTILTQKDYFLNMTNNILSVLFS